MKIKLLSFGKFMPKKIKKDKFRKIVKHLKEYKLNKDTGEFELVSISKSTILKLPKKSK